MQSYRCLLISNPETLYLYNGTNNLNIASYNPSICERNVSSNTLKIGYTYFNSVFTKMLGIFNYGWYPRRDDIMYRVRSSLGLCKQYSKLRCIHDCPTAFHWQDDMLQETCLFSTMSSASL